MRQVQQMQSRAEKVQNELKTREFEGKSGGGAVQVIVNGSFETVKITISPDVFKDGDVEMLQDLVMTATNDAVQTARKTTEEEMGKLTGGMKLPGLF